MKEKSEKVVWDSCVIIDALQKTPGRYELIEPFLHEAHNKKLQIVISEISVTEVSHLKELGKQGIPIDEQIELIDDWLENPFIVRRPVIPGISELAKEIGRKFNLKRAADRIVVATAQFDNIPLIHTFDGIDSQKKSKMLPLDNKIGDPPIRIMEPNPAFGTLFAI